MRKALIIALGLVATGALVGMPPAEAKQKGPPANTEHLPPKFNWFNGSAWVVSKDVPVVDPREYGPRPHPQPTDPAFFKRK